MKSTKKTVRLSAEMVDRLRAEAAERKCSVSALVNMFCEWGFNFIALEREPITDRR